MPTYRLPVQIAWNGPGSPGVNVWHVRTVADFAGDADEIAAASAAVQAFYTACNACYPTSCTQTFLGEVQTIASQGSLRKNIASWTRTGTGGTVLAPQLLQLVISWRTATASRSGSGRTFVGPLTQTAVGGTGFPIAARLAELRVAGSTLINTSTSANGWAVGVYSRTENIFRDFTGSFVRDKFAFLSSRRD